MSAPVAPLPNIFEVPAHVDINSNSANGNQSMKGIKTVVPPVTAPVHCILFSFFLETR